MRQWIKVLTVAFTLVGGIARGVPVIAAPGVAPADVPVYAVLSLIGDRLDIVVRQLQTGTRVDNNLHQSVAMTDPVFDSVAVSAVATAVRLADAKAELAAINTRSQLLFDQQRTLFEVSNGVMAMPDAIRNALRDQGATKLVLIGKHRDDASFKFATGYSDGAGKLEGLGFYLDGTWRTVTRDALTGNSLGGQGFIAPFAYLQVTLVDFPSGRVIGRKLVTAAIMAGAGRAQQDIGEPWNALTSAEKVRLINRLIERELAVAVRELIAQK